MQLALGFDVFQGTSPGNQKQMALKNECPTLSIIPIRKWTLYLPRILENLSTSGPA